MTLNNPTVAPIIAMIAIFIVSLAIALTVVWLAHRAIVARMIDKHTEGALRHRDEQIRVLQDELILRDARIVTMKGRLAQVNVFLGKAVSAAGLEVSNE